MNSYIAIQVLATNANANLDDDLHKQLYGLCKDYREFYQSFQSVYHTFKLNMCNNKVFLEQQQWLAKVKPNKVNKLVIKCGKGIKSLGAIVTRLKSSIASGLFTESIESLEIRVIHCTIELTEILDLLPNVRNVLVHSHCAVGLGPNDREFDTFVLDYDANARIPNSTHRLEFNVSNLNTRAFKYFGNGNLRGSATVSLFEHRLEIGGGPISNSEPDFLLDQLIVKDTYYVHVTFSCWLSQLEHPESDIQNTLSNSFTSIVSDMDFTDDGDIVARNHSFVYRHKTRSV